MSFRNRGYFKQPPRLAALPLDQGLDRQNHILQKRRRMGMGPVKARRQHRRSQPFLYSRFHSRLRRTLPIVLYGFASICIV